MSAAPEMLPLALSEAIRVHSIGPAASYSSWGLCRIHHSPSNKAAFPESTSRIEPTGRVHRAMAVS